MRTCRPRSLLKLVPVVAVIASAHVALAEQPGTAAVPVEARITVSSQEPRSSARQGDAILGVAASPTVVAVDTVETSRDALQDAPDGRQVECIAKVVLHEAGNQPLRGRMAVAQVIRARVRDGRFGRDACSVVAQRGQFFDVNGYRPSRTTDRWADAVEIARQTLSDGGEEVVPGALFFHSAGASMRGRVFVAQVADHFFYR